jgi:hypothetical protein
MLLQQDTKVISLNYSPGLGPVISQTNAQGPTQVTAGAPAGPSGLITAFVPPTNTANPSGRNDTIAPAALASIAASVTTFSTYSYRL